MRKAAAMPAVPTTMPSLPASMVAKPWGGTFAVQTYTFWAMAMAAVMSRPRTNDASTVLGIQLPAIVSNGSDLVVRNAMPRTVVIVVGGPIFLADYAFDLVRPEAAGAGSQLVGHPLDKVGLGRNRQPGASGFERKVDALRRGNVDSAVTGLMRDGLLPRCEAAGAAGEESKRRPTAPEYRLHLSTDHVGPWPHQDAEASRSLASLLAAYPRSGDAAAR